MSKIFLKINFLFFGVTMLLIFLLSIVPGASAANEYKIEIGLPNLPTGTAVSDPGAYVKVLFIFGLSLAGFLAVGAIAWGGILWMTASSVGSKDKAKAWIIGALSGIVLLLCSYLILTTIDPTLTNLTPKIEKAADIVEPPSPPDTGITQGAVTPTGGLEIKCKTVQICQDIQSGQMNSTLIRDLSSLPVSVTVTETTGSHGCTAGSACVAGAACGTSSHCTGRAADIRVSNLTSSQQQQVMQALSQDKCVDQLFYSAFPQYCLSSGQSASQSSTCASHTDHIHYSVKANCA